MYTSLSNHSLRSTLTEQNFSPANSPYPYGFLARLKVSVREHLEQDVPTIRARQYVLSRGILELHMPGRFLPTRKRKENAPTFLEMIQVDSCDIPGICPFEACTTILVHETLGDTLYERVLALLLGREIFHFARACLRAAQSGHFGDYWVIKTITDEELEHIKLMLKTDYESVHRFD